MSTFYSILITPEEKIEKYSIFTIQANSVEFQQNTPTAKSDQIEQSSHQLVYITNKDVILYPTARIHCRIIGANEAFLLTYDEADGTPEINTQVGPKPGTYKITPKSCGLLTVSPPNENYHLIWCIRDYGPITKIGVLDEDLEYNSTATMSVYNRNWSTNQWEDSTEDITVYDWLLIEGMLIPEGYKVIAQRHYNGLWLVSDAQCDINLSDDFNNLLDHALLDEGV